MPFSPRATFLSWLLLATVYVGSLHADGLARLKEERLVRVRQSILELSKNREEPVRSGRFVDMRANLHVHSRFSHDSRGSLDEIVAAAKRAGTRVLMFTEHPAEDYDFYQDGHQGLHDGVLCIPGAEMKGFLCYPTGSVRGIENEPPQGLSDLIRGRDGLMFVSHLEERMEWRIRGVTGVEIYNTHADFKDETALLKALRNPLWLLQSAELFRKYPQEAFSALQDYPADYLRRWDELCVDGPHTGVSANDAHQNVGLVMKKLDSGKVRIEDALEKKLLDLDATGNPLLEPLIDGKDVGETVFELRIDPYERSLRHVGTHLLLEPNSELTREAVWEALQAGRAYVAFDWLADATGFDFAAVSPDVRHEMGSQFPVQPAMRLVARSPIAVDWRLIRDGKLVAESTGRQFEAPLVEPGIYRIEAWLEVASEKQIWVLSNPVYATGLRK